MAIQASLPSGTRDFGPVVLKKRNHIVQTIKHVFELYAYQALETPAMENLSTLTGKYGEEGDQLLFKILNSRLHESSKKEQLQEAFSKSLEGAYNTPLISERALRYDLTIPFARYATMNRNEITLPYKRYQIQPVWRADKPQRGRYREFYQCDADVIGSDSLLNEVELIAIYQQVFATLHIDVKIKINNRKVLQGLCELCGWADRFTQVTVIIDKLDKIGLERVKVELLALTSDAAQVDVFLSHLADDSGRDAKLQKLLDIENKNPNLIKGIEELQELFTYLKNTDNLELDFTLARGLDYYTGCILEVVSTQATMGSIGGGGRYDDLTGIFGWKGVSGVGISFGLDRIYDVMEELQLFPESQYASAEVLVLNFPETLTQAYDTAQALRHADISCMLYPDAKKIQKQMEYAHRNAITWVMILGEQEVQSQTISLKNMRTGEQEALPLEQAILKIQKTKSI